MWRQSVDLHVTRGTPSGQGFSLTTSRTSPVLSDGSESRVLSEGPERAERP